MVIGNPPYIQLKRLTEKKLYNGYYKTYCGNGNIYCIFYELANNLLCFNGIGIFITMNAWYISNYGDKARQFILDNASPTMVVDLGSNVFSNATVDTSIFMWKRHVYVGKTMWATIYDKSITDLNDNDFREVNLKGISLWKGYDGTEAIKERLSFIKTNISSYDLNLYYGILTGANKVFLLDKARKEELVNKDKKNSEIIKPILRGEDIGRYTAQFRQQYLLCTHNGVESKHILPIDINDYPTLFEYFNSFGEKFKERGEQGQHYWNLRSCQYIMEFEFPKIIYADIVQEKGKFYYDDSNFYTNDTAFIICGKSRNLKIILAFLNSCAFSFFYKNFYCGGSLGEKGLRYKKDFLLRVPIPMGNEEQEDKLISLVDSIMSLKHENIDSDTSDLEAEIDRIVYDLYGLTDDEIKIVEGK